jgi:hypothetical protein
MIILNCKLNNNCTGRRRMNFELIFYMNETVRGNSHALPEHSQ